jgi:hypothetical protein
VVAASDDGFLITTFVFFSHLEERKMFAWKGKGVSASASTTTTIRIFKVAFIEQGKGGLLSKESKGSSGVNLFYGSTIFRMEFLVDFY